MQLSDKVVLDFISDKLGGSVRVDHKTNQKRKKFPRARWSTQDSKLFNDFYDLVGGRLKDKRKLPLINGELDKFLLQGFFDAEGCITFGKRKEDNRLWHKIGFTSKRKMLKCIIKILNKYNINNLNLRQKGNEKM